MSIETEADILEFFDEEDFAVSAVISPIALITAYSVSGFFDNDYFPAEGGEINIDSASPGFTCPTSELQSPAQGDGIVINSIAYKIQSVQPDGTGITTLILRKP